MKNAMKKWLALLLTVLMVAAAMPFGALAEGDLIEEELAPVETETLAEPETPAEPVVNVSNAVAAVNLLAAGEEDTNTDISAAAISGSTTVKVNGTITLTSNKGYNYSSYHSWSSSDTSVATVTNNGKSAVVKGVSEGTVTITHKYYQNYQWHTETYEVTVSGIQTEDTELAQVYYLKTPTSDPNSNKTDQWGRNIGNGSVNTTGATWTNSKNIFSPAPYVVSLADGMTKQDDGSWHLPKNDTYAQDYEAIFTAYKSQLESSLGVTLTKDDIEAIYLIPYKISRDNWTSPDKHIDCTISVKTAEYYTARFWVTLPDGTRNLVDAKDYKQSEFVEQTTVAPAANTDYPPEITIDGLKFVFDGWYNEAGEKVTSWNYTPSESDLADGAVEFEAYYVPAETTITVTKTVNSEVDEDNNKEFTFNYTVNGVNGEPFTLKNGGSKDLIVSIGAAFVVTETADNAFATIYTVDNAESVEGVSAAISSVDGSGHTIAFTNTRKLISVTATKQWEDQNNLYTTRPESVTLKLMNGTVEVATAEVTAATNWSCTWNNLPEYDASGNKINYTVEETPVTGYVMTAGNADNDYVVTNTLETVDITATKTWVGDTNENGTVIGPRPESITLYLRNGEVTIDTQTVYADAVTGEWYYTWSARPKYDAQGEEINYNVAEGAVPGYTAVITGDVANGFAVTNTLNTHTLTVKKTVSGNMGDQSKEFAFITTIAGEENSASLAHNGTVEYIVPYGAEVTVTENPDGYTYSFVSAKDAAGNDVSVSTEGTADGISFTMPDGDVTVVINNDKTATVDTGILLDSLPYVLILGVVGAALVLWFIRKRRVDD